MYILNFPKFIISEKERKKYCFLLYLLKNECIKIEDIVILSMLAAFKVPGSGYADC